MLPKPSVDGWLTLVGLGYVTRWWWWEKSHSPHSQKSKETKKEKMGVYSPFKGTPQRPGEHLLGRFELSHFLSISNRVETTILTHRLLGSIYFLNDSSTLRGSSTCLHVCVCRVARQLSGARPLGPCCAEQRDGSTHWEHTCSETHEEGLLRRESQPCPCPGDRRTRKPVSESLMQKILPGPEGAKVWAGLSYPECRRLTRQVDTQQNWKYGVLKGTECNVACCWPCFISKTLLLQIIKLIQNNRKHRCF